MEIMQNQIIIDDAFIERWEAKYDTISQDTLEEIYNWKAARAKGYVKWEDYCKYEEVLEMHYKLPRTRKYQYPTNSIY